MTEHAVYREPRRSLFPKQWEEWNGPPPHNPDEIQGWAMAAIFEGQVRRDQGEPVPWLASGVSPRAALARLEHTRPAATNGRAAQLALLARRNHSPG